jgi:hypothetical protein
MTRSLFNWSDTLPTVDTRLFGSANLPNLANQGFGSWAPDCGSKARTSTAPPHAGHLAVVASMPVTPAGY